MSGDVTFQSLERLTRMPDDTGVTGDVIAGQKYYDVYFTGGAISGVTISSATFTNNTISGGTISGAAITGGSIDNCPIGATTASTVKGTTVSGNAFVPLSATVPTYGLYGTSSSIGLSNNGHTVFSSSDTITSLFSSNNLICQFIGASGGGAFFQMASSTTFPFLNANGSGSDVDLGLFPKGAGRLRTGSIAANGTVATVLGSLGPTGSNTTVQEWLAVKNSGGTTRYIPMF